MADRKRIIVRGKPRVDIDPLVFLQTLLAISATWDCPPPAKPSADSFNASIEDTYGAPGDRAS